MRRRDLLHKNKIQDFIKWAESKGYVSLEVKGDFEVIRLSYDGEPPISFYAKLEPTQHVTAHGLGLRLVKLYLSERKTYAGTN